MKKIKVVTDSTVDLSNEVLQQYEIEVVPLSIHINGETFQDRVDITPEEFMVKMAQSKELPKSSQPPVGQFLETYDRLGEEGYDVISIHMSGGLSGTVQSAESAAKMSITNVSVVDSRFVSFALSFQVLEAARMAKQGKDVEEILARLQIVREQTRLYVVVDTFENLIKGGRIGKGKALIGSLLNIKPIASLVDGVYNPITNVRSYKQVVKYLAEQFSEDVKGKTIKGVGIAHAGGQELAAKVEKAVSEVSDFVNIEVEYTNPVVSTHAGPGAIGFMYYFD